MVLIIYRIHKALLNAFLMITKLVTEIMVKFAILLDLRLGVILTLLILIYVIQKMV